MRRFMLLAALCAALVLALTPVVMAQPNPMPNPMPNPNPTPNTGTTQYQAPISTGTQQMGDVDCPELTQPQAQAIFDADPSDPNGLDADNDSIACEDGGGAAQPTAPVQQYTQQPIAEAVDEETSSTTTTTPLPDTGGFPLAPLAGASLLVLGAAGFAMRRRIS